VGVADHPEIRENARPVRFASDGEWLANAAERQPAAIIGSLVAAWTGLPFALWAAVAGVIFGTVAGLIGLSVLGGFLGSLANNQGVSLLGAAVGAVAGLFVGFGLIYFYLVTHPLQLAGAIVSGIIISVVVLLVMVRAERWLLELRGYRQPSRREGARLYPLLREAGERMGLAVVPALWISDAMKPGAWSHMRAIVVTRGLLGDYDATEKPPRSDLDDTALTAILAHELHHWAVGDAAALAMVSACFYPFVLIVNAVSWVRKRAEWAGIVLWAFFWPVWIASRFVVVPLMARESRRAEYEADAAAASLGDEYRLGLRRALDELSVWERPRTGWEDVLAASHPPIEYRMERLEAPPEDEPAPPPVRKRAAPRKAKPMPQPAPVEVTPPPELEPVVTDEQPDDDVADDYEDVAAGPPPKTRMQRFNDWFTGRTQQEREEREREEQGS
jgi:Zn-dependent protease with chaperone function